jgi:putative nucleotidyltransferase with HDIG domain
MKLNISKYSHWTAFDSSRRFRLILLIGITVIFVCLVYPNLVITQPAYMLGDVAERDIKAPKDFFIEDAQATEANRQRAVESVLTLYDYDPSLAGKLAERVEQAFSTLRATTLAWEQYHALERIEPLSDGPLSESDAAAASPALPNVWEKKEWFAEQLGLEVGDGAYRILVDHAFSEDIAGLMIQIVSRILDNGVVASKTILLKDSDNGVILKDLETKNERIVTNLKQFYDLDQAKNMARIIGYPLLQNHDYTVRNLIVDYVQQLIQPNITLNKSETEDRRLRAAAEIKPVLYKIKAGEMLLREGERITSLQLLKLNALKDQKKFKEILINSVGAALLIICLLVTFYFLHHTDSRQTSREQNKSLLFLATMLVSFLLLAQVAVMLSESLTATTTSDMTSSTIMFGIPLYAGPMITCLFMGLSLAIPFALVLAICTAIIYHVNFTIFIYFLINGAMAAYWIRDCRERKVFIKAGAKLGLLNVFLVTAIDIYTVDYAGAKMLWDWAFAFTGGILAGIVTAGIGPLIEIAFDYTTDIKLLELANLDRPILKRLLIEAPGTYHHSVIVGALVEAAAADIDANPLLAKVCGYYHDIGKIKKPLYFIENQSNGKNKHDKLAPSMSSLILLSHVKDGVEIARENRLGKLIMDAIQQHHGTSLITYFYDKAKQQKGEDAVKIDDFRYQGPRPQTKEFGLVMLADMVEAASRTLNNPTPARIQGLVQNLINKAFSDGQLDNCELTLRDLHKIAKSFNKILNAIHHNRVEYPEPRLAANGQLKDVNPDRKQTKKHPDGGAEHSEKSPGRLRRLGQT